MSKKSSAAAEKMPLGARITAATFDWFDTIVIALVIVILLLTFFVAKVEVSGPSMMNTLQDQDHLVMVNFNYKPKTGDIVIISRNYSNKFSDQKTADKPIVKRVIATGGQTVEIKEGKVYVDGSELKEPYLDPELVMNGTSDGGFTGIHTVPEGRVFVLGDNRAVSHDSRKSDIGFVDERYILGKVWARIYPFNEFKTF